jgi:hypothetical protein
MMATESPGCSIFMPAARNPVTPDGTSVTASRARYGGPIEIRQAVSACGPWGLGKTTSLQNRADLCSDRRIQFDLLLRDPQPRIEDPKYEKYRQDENQWPFHNVLVLVLFTPAH